MDDGEACDKADARVADERSQRERGDSEGAQGKVQEKKRDLMGAG